MKESWIVPVAACPPHPLQDQTRPASVLVRSRVVRQAGQVSMGRIKV
jgi:hypothetical protein